MVRVKQRFLVLQISLGSGKAFRPGSVTGQHVWTAIKVSGYLEQLSFWYTHIYVAGCHHVRLWKCRTGKSTDAAAGCVAETQPKRWMCTLKTQTLQ